MSILFDIFLGVGLLTRKVGAVVKPILTITQSADGKKWSMLSESTFKNAVTEFELGKAFDETTIDGRVLKVRTTFNRVETSCFSLI